MMVVDVFMSATSLSLYYRSIEAQMGPEPTLHGFLIQVESGGRVGTIKAAAIFQPQILGIFSLVAHHAAHGQQKLV